MKFFIDGNEIKTVNKNAIIQGSLSLVSRCAMFSYIYAKESGFINYGAKVGSKVLIQNDKDKNIFMGTVTKISYSPMENIVQIQAQDMLYLFLYEKIKGRFRGAFLTCMQKITSFLSQYKFYIDAAALVKQDINILNFGNLSLYDIIHLMASKIYGEEFKIYIDGNNNIKFLIPEISGTKTELIAGKNILSASFSASNEENKNIANINALGNDEIVSGTVVKITDPVENVSGYFVVTSDRHVYSDIYTMELNLAERKFL